MNAEVNFRHGILGLYSSSIHLNSSCVFVTGITLEFGVFLVPRVFW
jgi:hypothetical protein